MTLSSDAKRKELELGTYDDRMLLYLRARTPRYTVCCRISWSEEAFNRPHDQDQAPLLGTDIFSWTGGANDGKMGTARRLTLELTPSFLINWLKMDKFHQDHRLALSESSLVHDRSHHALVWTPRTRPSTKTWTCGDTCICGIAEC